MLKVITLFTIDKIFSIQTEQKVTALAKMLYISCLTQHFKTKEATVANAFSFEMFKNDIPNYNNYEQLFQQLHKAELVVICFDRVCFNNVWGQHIDRSILSAVNPQNFIGAISINVADHYTEELLKNTSIYEMLSIKYKISAKQIDQLIELFVKEQVAFQKKYTSLSDCARHLTFWIPHNIGKANTTETVKSKSKLLGE